MRGQKTTQLIVHVQYWKARKPLRGQDIAGAQQTFQSGLGWQHKRAEWGMYRRGMGAASGLSFYHKYSKLYASNNEHECYLKQSKIAIIANLFEFVCKSIGHLSSRRKPRFQIIQLNKNIRLLFWKHQQRSHFMWPRYGWQFVLPTSCRQFLDNMALT